MKKFLLFLAATLLLIFVGCVQGGTEEDDLSDFEIGLEDDIFDDESMSDDELLADLDSSDEMGFDSDGVSVDKSDSVKDYTPTSTKRSQSYGSDPINKVRMLLRNGKLNTAKSYVDGLDFNNLPAGVDKGEMYHFKGVTYFYLADKPNSRHFRPTAVESFENAHKFTQKEKIKALSMLWLGMFYDYYYYKTASEMEKGVHWLDRVLNEYPRTRFANDALFYKALLYKKLRKPGYRDMLIKVKNGGYVDTHVYWKWTKRYVSARWAADYVLGKGSSDKSSYQAPKETTTTSDQYYSSEDRFLTDEPPVVVDIPVEVVYPSTSYSSGSPNGDDIAIPTAEETPSEINVRDEALVPELEIRESTSEELIDIIEEEEAAETTDATGTGSEEAPDSAITDEEAVEVEVEEEVEEEVDEEEEFDEDEEFTDEEFEEEEFEEEDEGFGLPGLGF